MDIKFEILMIFTVGFALASLLGYLAQRFNLPYILGYLLAGYLIGPFSPGYAADIKVAEQLAEIGIVLMLFGVGLHFKLEDLYRVKHVAIPGALCQTVVSSLAGALFVYHLGWPIQSGLITGLAVGVASTVVLVKVLTDFHMLSTLEGHIAVGWLVVEDILTVAVLILLPILATEGDFSVQVLLKSIVMMVVKLTLLGLLMFTLGRKVVEFILINVARVRSHELFTLTVLSLIFIVATGSAALFGTSIALGAFIAGMIIGQTEVRHQALANALPIKDIFAVIFFLSIGMLFNPAAIVTYPYLFFGLLAIILILKPLSALLIVLGFSFTLKVALTVAIALAQIGEFSFILAQEANRLNLLPDEAFDLLVACALITISINPILFKVIALFEKKTAKLSMAKILNPKDLPNASGKAAYLFETQVAFSPKVVLVGYGSLGQEIAQSLEKKGISPSIVEQDIDAIPAMRNEVKHVFFGDAGQEKILESAKVEKAHLLVITPREIETTLDVIRSARHLHPKITIIARLAKLEDKLLLDEMNVEYVSAETEEVKAFLRKVALHIQK